MFEFVSSDSMIHRLDPRTKVIWLVLVTFLAIIIRDPLSLLLLFSITLIILFLVRMSAEKIKQILLLYILIIIGATLSQALFYVPKEGLSTSIITLVSPDMLLIGLITGGISLSLEGAVYGCIQSLRILAMLNTSVILVMTSPLNRIIIGLRQMGVPSTLAFMLATAVRFVPTIMEEYKMICNAQRARGLISSAHPIRFFEFTFTPLILNSVRRCTQLALAAESRCFGSEVCRTAYIELSFTVLDFISLILSACIGFLLIFNSWNQGGLIL